MPRYEFGLPIYEPNLDDLDLDDSVKYTFVLGTGAFDASYWQLCGGAIRSLGHYVLQPKLPLGEPEATFKDDAEAMRLAIGDCENVVKVDHSRSVETNRMLETTDAGQFVLLELISTGGPHSFRLPSKYPHAFESRYTQSYLRALGRMINGTLLPEDARKHFYNDVRPTLAIPASENLQSQRDSANDRSGRFALPPADKLQRVVSLGAFDETLNIPRAIEVSRAFAGVVPRILPTGHTPQLAKPSLLALYLINDANRARKGLLTAA